MRNKASYHGAELDPDWGKRRDIIGFTHFYRIRDINTSKF